MGAWREELRSYAGEPRGGAGWRLAKTGWRLLRRDRTAATLALLVFLCFALASLTPALGNGLALWGSGSSHLARDTAISGLVLLFVSFLLVALASAVDGAVDGLPLDLREALGDARARLGAIVGWAAIALVAWVGLRLLPGADTLAWLLSTLAYVVWFAVTLFVLPAIAIERLGAVAALAESRRAFAADWRAACGGLVGIVAFAAAALIVPGTLLSHAAALNREGNGTDYPLLVGGTVLLELVLALALATREAFAVLQLRAVLDDLPAGEYAGRRLRRRAKVGRVAAGFAVLVAVLVLIGVLTKGDQKTLQTSREPGANYTSLVNNPGQIDLPSGAPVIYRGAKVGTVLGSHDDGDGLSVTFHVEPGIGPETAPGYLRVVDAGAFGPSLVLIPAPGGAGGSGSSAQPF